MIFPFLSEEIAPFTPVLLFLIIEWRFVRKGKKRLKMENEDKGREDWGKKQKPEGNILFSYC